MGQEFDSNEKIAEFCSTKFGVSFPLMARSVVRGEETIPLYNYLVNESHFPGKITWNFNKFLIGPDGHVISPIRLTRQTRIHAPRHRRSASRSAKRRRGN